MLIEWAYDLFHNIDRHGLRWGVAITIYALFRKERRNFYLDKRDDAIFQNQKLIMGHLGIGDQWRGHLTMSKVDQQNFKRLYLSLHRGIQSASQLKRRVGMMGKLAENLTSKKLWAFVLMVIINGLNDTLQLGLSHDAVNNITQGGTAYIVIQGVVDAILGYVKQKGAADNGSRVLPENNR